MVQDKEVTGGGGFGTDGNLSSSAAISSHNNLSFIPKDSYQHHPADIDDCVYYAVDFPEWKLWSCLLVGSTICLVGTVTNAFLILILLRRNLRHSYMMYLRVLAFLDIVILISYLAVHSTWVVYDRFQVLWLYIAWTKYVVVFMFLSKSTLVASTYLIVAVSAERLLEVFKMRTGRNAQISQKRRWCVVGVLMIFSFAFKMPGFWELEPAEHHDPNCTGFGRYSIRPLLVKNPHYQKYYIGIVDNCVRVVIPFIALIICNGIIIVQWKRSIANESTPIKEAKNQFTIFNDRLLVPAAGAAETVQSTIEAVRQREKEAKRRGLKSATKMMLAIVASYLLCNLLNLFITFWEIIDISWLVTNRKLYEMMTDIVTLLTITNASLRLPIYYACNPKIRDEIKGLFMEISNCIDKGAFKDHFPISVRNGGQLISKPGIATDGTAGDSHQNNHSFPHSQQHVGFSGYGDHHQSSPVNKNSARVEFTHSSITYSTGTTVAITDSCASKHPVLRESSSPPIPSNGQTAIVVGLTQKKTWRNRWSSLKSTLGIDAGRSLGRSFIRVGADNIKNSNNNNDNNNDDTETSLVHTTATLTNSMSLPPPPPSNNTTFITPADNKNPSCIRNNSIAEKRVCLEQNKQHHQRIMTNFCDGIEGATNNENENENEVHQVPNGRPNLSKNGNSRLGIQPSSNLVGDNEGVLEADEEKQSLLMLGNDTNRNCGMQVRGGRLFLANNDNDQLYSSTSTVPITTTNSITTFSSSIIMMNSYDKIIRISQSPSPAHFVDESTAPTIKCSTATTDLSEQNDHSPSSPDADRYEKCSNTTVRTMKHHEKNELVDREPQQSGLPTTTNCSDRWAIHDSNNDDYSSRGDLLNDLINQGDNNDVQSLSDPTTIIYV